MSDNDKIPICLWFVKGKCRITKTKCENPKNVDCKTYDI